MLYTVFIKKEGEVVDNIPRIVGQRIKRIRKELGMNQSEFAKLINATVPAVSNWENGRNLPNSERLKSIADVGKISVNDLYSGIPSNTQLNKWDSKHNKDGELTKEVEKYEDVHSSLKEVDVLDVADMMKFLIEQLHSDNQHLKFEGEKLTDNTRESLLKSFENSYQISKLINKK